MLTSEYKELIMASLGGSVVDIELENDIGTFLKLALLEVAPYISTSQLMTVPYQPVIDLSDKGVYNVVTVYRGDPSNESNLTGLTDEALLFSNKGYSVVGAGSSSNLFNLSYVDQMAIRLLSNQVLGTIRGMSDIDFYFDNNKLYINSVMTGNITIEYNPTYSTVDSITDPFWSMYIYRLTVAHTKVALGRVRGKYRVSSTPYELDADTLLSEGNSEIETIRAELRDSADIFYILD